MANIGENKMKIEIAMQGGGDLDTYLVCMRKMTMKKRDLSIMCEEYDDEEERATTKLDTFQTKHFFIQVRSTSATIS
tara:strand:+ start:970 stop:1200 length:231 start_codon:yes stop_codon:yes gene_type:complete